MSPKETKTDGKYNINMGWVSFLPIMLLLGLVPLVTRLAVVEVDQVTYSVFGRRQIFDFFSQNKAGLIIGIAGIIIIVLFLVFDKTKLKLDRTIKAYYLLIGIYLLFSIISTFLSEYKDIAIWGIADRSEGILVLIAYVVMMVYAIYMINSGRDYKYIIAPLCILVVITGVIGFFQYIGQDPLLNTELGRKLIVPEKYAQLRESLGSQFESERIYGTMYHYNYMGSFGAMMVPLFLTLTLFIKGYKSKIAFGLMTAISAFLLFGSTSRAGIIGLACSLIIFIIVFGKKIIKNYKFTLPVILIAVVGVVGLNAATQGAIFERVPSLIKDAAGIFLPGDETFDYKAHIPVKNIYTEGNTVVLETQSDRLVVSPTDEGLAFTDQNGTLVEYVKGEKDYTTQDTRFKAYSFNKQSLGEGINRDFIVMMNKGAALLAAEINIPEGARFVNKVTLLPEPIVEAESIGFKGKERIGSARGYIWSRSLPMLMDTLLIGNGPDTYALEFPQNDILGKWYAYETPNMVVDKPHNLYLQIGINQSGVALLAFLAFIGIYVVQSLRLYTFKAEYEVLEIAGVASFVAVIGYLGAGLFNDSIVSVAPIFWILLGAGIGSNFLVIREKKRQCALKDHATINMKTRKHV